ncbi:MAG TPA: serine dehydratase, partial [Lachnospiraceae bacterium]|nr:serine dehydratase [Lachnospiraceae bacterium]
EVYPENSFAEVEEFCRFRSLDLAEYVFLTEKPGIREFLAGVWNQMKQTIREGLETEGYLPGPLKVERKAMKLYDFEMEHFHPQVEECRLISAYAYATAEQNADCGTVVTAPTCGACGVVPAAFLYVQKRRNLSDEEMVKGLAVAGLIGNLIKHNASISGAECGCQAEIGSACAMAAAGLDYLYGLSTNQIQYAAEIALEHHLGLTCDPILGLVQVPCIERNAVAAMRAMNCCNLSFFLSDTQRISFDIAVRTMYETGKSINRRFRETSEGGLAKMYGRRNQL